MTGIVIYNINQECIPKNSAASALATVTTTATATKLLVPPVQNNQQSFNILDRYSKQIRLQKELEEKIERMNEKYNFGLLL